MFDFSDSDELSSRIPDRPARRVPMMISQMPEIPWLASKYEPKPSDRPSIKQVIGRGVRTAIPLLGTLAVLGVIAFVAVKLFAQY